MADNPLYIVFIYRCIKFWSAVRSLASEPCSVLQQFTGTTILHFSLGG